jgi:hypothetical protein
VYAREKEKLKRNPPKPKREKRRTVKCEDCDRQAIFHLPQPPAGEAASVPPPPAMATATAKKARTATFSQRLSETAKAKAKAKLVKAKTKNHDGAHGELPRWCRACAKAHPGALGPGGVPAGRKWAPHPCEDCGTGEATVRALPGSLSGLSVLRSK